MKNNKSDILSRIGKDAGFKVPEGYFDSFTSQMESKLPEQEVHPIPQPTKWQKIRPFIYMAAMFVGIWLMMKIFNGFGEKEHGFYNPEIVAGFQNDSNIDYLMMGGDISEYDILTYQDSVSSYMQNASFVDSTEN